jgi:hypothetical protein
MTFFPQHRVSRVAAALWLLVCVATLAVLLLQPGIPANERPALTVLVPLYFLSFPLGHAGLMAGIEIKLALYLNGSPAPSILAEGLFLWTSFAVLGYLQWFLLLPWLSRCCQRLFNRLFNRGAQRTARSR